jgi:hypothetical protein
VWCLIFVSVKVLNDLWCGAEYCFTKVLNDLWCGAEYFSTKVLSSFCFVVKLERYTTVIL